MYIIIDFVAIQTSLGVMIGQDTSFDCHGPYNEIWQCSHFKIMYVKGSFKEAAVRSWWGLQIARYMTVFLCMLVMSLLLYDLISFFFLIQCPHVLTN